MVGTTTQDSSSKAKQNSALTSTISGLLASSCGKSLMHPIDTIKAKLQVQSLQNRDAKKDGTPKVEANVNARKSVIYSIAKETVAKEGIGGLYRGFAINIIGSIPAAGLYFGSYEFFKTRTLQYQFLQNHPFISYLCGGMFAETIACMIFVPVDVIKERRQVQANLKAYEYKNDADAIRQILKTEGVPGLYRAYGATVMSFGPFSAFYFMFYEYIKGMIVQNDPQSYLKKVKRESDEAIQKSQQQDMGMVQTMLCSMIAGACASVITNPLDMAKLRLQVQRAGKIGGGEKSEFYYKHLADGIYKIGRDEGVRALFNGSFARILFHVPNVAITMSVVEFSKPRVQKFLDKMAQ